MSDPTETPGPRHVLQIADVFTKVLHDPRASGAVERLIAAHDANRPAHEAAYVAAGADEHASPSGAGGRP